MNDKFIILGLDGASYSLIGDWIDKGELPNFKRIMDNGYSSVLESTLPFHSAPAWTSLVTGVNPGKHGIYDFFYIQDNELKPVSSFRRKAPALWNILDEFDIRSIIINVPCTYPPEVLNGSMITGMMTPSKKSDYTYPDSLKDKLKNYTLDSWWQALPFIFHHRDDHRLLKITQDIITQRFTTFFELMKDDSWGLAFLVIRIMDHLQHYLWDNKDILLNAYKLVDRYVGEVIREYPQANIVIVSDHGFRGSKGCFFINNFLYNIHLLDFNLRYWFVIDMIKKITQKICGSLLKFIDMDRLARNDFFKMISNFFIFNTKKIYTKSKAFSPSASSCGIFIKDKNVRDHVIAELKKLKDPCNSNRIVKQIFKKEDIFSGPFLEDAPDIIYIVNDDYTMSDRIRLNGLRIKDLFAKEQKLIHFDASADITHNGEHSRDGILMAGGPLVKQKRGSTESILSILPTILYGLGLGRFPETDGQIIDMYNKRLNDNQLNIKYTRKNKEFAIRQEDSEAIKDRLKSLGYIE
ncbi:alkaline phosphatase family protein [Elusimicrobiota bacterium]